MNPMDGDSAFHLDPVCDVVVSLLPFMYSNEITPDNLARLHAHLESCEQCRHRYEQLGALIIDCQRLLTPFLNRSKGTSETDLDIPSFQDILHAADALQAGAEVDQESQDSGSHNGGDTAESMRLILPGQHVAASFSQRLAPGTRGPSVLQSHGSLTRADSPDMHNDRHYSAAAASCLAESYALGTRQRYQPAIRILLPLVKAPIARSQAIRVRYYLGLWHAALDDYFASTGYLDEAANWVIRSDTVENMLAAAQISHALGENHYHTLQCASAIEYYTLAIDALDVARTGSGADEVNALQEWTNLRLAAMLRLASQYFLLSKYEDAQRIITAVEKQLKSNPDIPHSSLHRASASWISALLCRWVGNSAAGMKDIFEALDIYGRSNSPFNSARAQIVASDIILDIVESHGIASMPTSALAPLVHLAKPYTMQALQATHSLGDTSGEFMAGLAHIRLLRVTNNQAFDRRAILDSMIQQAKQARQPSLLGLAYTSSGDEFLHQGALEQAGNCYRCALDVLRNTDVPAYGIFARRALLCLSEGLLAEHPGSSV